MTRWEWSAEKAASNTAKHGISFVPNEWQGVLVGRMISVRKADRRERLAYENHVRVARVGSDVRRGDRLFRRRLHRRLDGRSHDAHDGKGGDVQIKLTGGTSVAMYAGSVRLVVLRIVSTEEAEIVYDGPGRPAWDEARPIARNGQRVIALSKLRALASA